MKLDVCKNKECKKKFTPERDFQTTCDYKCAIEYASQLKEKREKAKKTKGRIALREFKKSDKPLQLQIAQATVNKFIRLRDKDLRCVSCGHDFTKGRQQHAGHYIARSKSSLLRFDERNINTQCNICNDHLSGNVGEYRVGLIAKIGIEEVEYLEANKNTLKTWTIEELQEVITTYKAKNKLLESN